jgi:SAM-dependent methyltransferase
VSQVATTPDASSDAAVPMEQLELPIDQFQRYLLTSRLVRLLDVPAGGRILDLGGAPGPIEMFLPDHEVYVLDIQGEHPGGRFVIADGGRLPFGDDTFDAVVSLDTLEHVPTSVRADFLSEARRVSTGAVVLSAPFDTLGVAAAERALLEFISARLSPDFPTAVWLQEHVDWGLPKLDRTLTDLSGGGWVSDALPSGYLPRWLGTMVADHELLATGLPDLNGLHAYYNAHVSPSDARTPSYRHIVAASCRISQEELGRRIDSLRSAPEDPVEATAALSAMAAALLQHRLGGSFSSPQLRDALADQERLRARVHDLERQVADRDARLLEQEHRSAALEQQVADLSQKLADASLRALVKRTTRGKLG